MNDHFTTPKTMKSVIHRRIRATLLEQGSSTKVELSDALGISFPTISKFLSKMEKEGEIISVGLDQSSGGRRAKRYAYNPEHMLGLAIFLERTETNFSIFNCLGKVKEQSKTNSVDNIDKLTKLIEGIFLKYPKISSIAIGVPGSVDNGRVFFIPDYEYFQDVDLKKYFEDYFSIPVVVENDMNAAVLGYYKYKAIKEDQSMIYLSYGQNGPGSGILINGKVVRGSTFFSGEVSFVPLYDNHNFLQEIGNKSKSFHEDNQIDAVARLIASVTAIINPHTFIFCNDEVTTSIIEKITLSSSKYIPREHLPEIKMSEWKQDYLHGLQSLGIDLMISNTSM
ncbi:ROK family protein [Lederbergia wuyishanensis]|uniref:NBD/HSP70 family sugar kinase n=1 Tax=Lederbergia wuyishanensis TaxID=1347903 RepID=A0ABU0D0C3_9BACI|nr:ROK family transcriptional regulator [Lederbergia wuyishanensis]MCJ8006479.1 ROK family transcriptional regulator [Lederbergia wuyishanensis]MDQ0341855.1 putative NBD/HSP70 family sugar kinase [Lederbergia wuyishanensis]